MILRHRSDRVRRGLVAAAFLAYVFASLAPFKWSPPRRVDNAAVASVAGLSFPAAGLARTFEAPAWIGRAIQQEQFHLDLRLRPHPGEQRRPARIFTVSRDFHLANFVLDQEGADLVLRLRRPGSTAAGKPPYTMRGVLRDGGWHDVAVAVASGSLRVAVDGSTVIEAELPDRPLAGWNPGYQVALGNELNGIVPWRGDIARAVVDVDGARVDYAQPVSTERPVRFWAFANHLRWGVREEITFDALEDWAANLVSFTLLGFFMAAIMWPDTSWRRTVLTCAIASLLVEVAQVFFSRHPDIIDWILNTVGGALGAWLAQWLARRGSPSTLPVSHAIPPGGNA
jgi:hypothetical protein